MFGKAVAVYVTIIVLALMMLIRVDGFAGTITTRRTTLRLLPPRRRPPYYDDSTPSWMTLPNNENKNHQYCQYHQRHVSFSNIPRRPRRRWELQNNIQDEEEQELFSSFNNDNDVPSPSLQLDPTTTRSSTTRVTVTGITLKIAVDQSGRVAPGENHPTLPSTSSSSSLPARFTCSESLDMVHRLRRDCDAVLVGKNTVVQDDCSLTVRRNVPLRQEQQQPTRVVIDPFLSLELEKYQIIQDGLSTILVHHHFNTSAIKNYTRNVHPDYPNVILLGIPTTQPTPSNTTNTTTTITTETRTMISMARLCNILQNEFHFQHIMVEGGLFTANQFLQEQFIDRAIIVEAPITFPTTGKHQQQQDDHDTTIPSSIFDRNMLQTTGGLHHLGSYTLGVDLVECYSRPSLTWPTSDLIDWP